MPKKMLHDTMLIVYQSHVPLNFVKNVNKNVNRGLSLVYSTIKIDIVKHT